MADLKNFPNTLETKIDVDIGDDTVTVTIEANFGRYVQSSGRRTYFAKDWHVVEVDGNCIKINNYRHHSLCDLFHSWLIFNGYTETVDIAIDAKLNELEKERLS